MTTDRDSVGDVVREMLSEADQNVWKSPRLCAWSNRLEAIDRQHSEEVAGKDYRLETATAFGEQCMLDIDGLIARAEKAEIALAEIAEASNPDGNSVFNRLWIYEKATSITRTDARAEGESNGLDSELHDAYPENAR